jgi:hypothetical protein
MPKFRLVAAAAVSLLALAAPAIAGGKDIEKHRLHVRHADKLLHDKLAYPSLPVYDAARWGYGTGYVSFPTGAGGLYGDGRYPDNVYENYSPYRPI